MFWSDGSVYKGNWHKGLQHGEGRLELPDGRIKQGIFKNNKLAVKKEVARINTIKEESDPDV